MGFQVVLGEKLLLLSFLGVSKDALRGVGLKILVKLTFSTEMLKQAIC